MEPKKHHIKKKIFEIKTNDRERALIIQDTVIGLTKKELLPLAEEILDELNPSLQYVKIDQLEIDLGVIQESNLNYDLPKRFAVALKEALKKELAASYSNNKVSENKTKSFLSESIKKRTLDGIIFFLVNGFYNWNVDHSGKDINSIVAEEITKHPEELSIAIKKNRNNNNFKKRLENQLNRSNLQRLTNLTKSKELTSWLKIWFEISNDISETVAQKDVLERSLLANAILYWEEGAGKTSQVILESFFERLEEGAPSVVQKFLQKARWLGSNPTVANWKTSSKFTESDVAADFLPEPISIEQTKETSVNAFLKKAAFLFAQKFQNSPFQDYAEFEEWLKKRAVEYIRDNQSSSFEEFLSYQPEITSSKLNIDENIKIRRSNFQEERLFENEILKKLDDFLLKGFWPKASRLSLVEILKHLISYRSESLLELIKTRYKNITYLRRFLRQTSIKEKALFFQKLFPSIYPQVYAWKQDQISLRKNDLIIFENLEEELDLFLLQIAITDPQINSLDEVISFLASSFNAYLGSQGQSSSKENQTSKITDLATEGDLKKLPIELEVIYHFLNYGQFPNWKKENYTNRFSELVEIAINKYPKEFAFVIDNIDTSTFQKRIPRYLDNQTFHQLVQTFPNSRNVKAIRSELKGSAKDREGAVYSDSENEETLLPDSKTELKLEDVSRLKKAQETQSEEETQLPSEDNINLDQQSFEEFLVQKYPSKAGMLMTIKIIGLRWSKRVKVQAAQSINDLVEKELKSVLEKVGVDHKPEKILTEFAFQFSLSINWPKELVIQGWRKTIRTAVEQGEGRFIPFEAFGKIEPSLIKRNIKKEASKGMPKEESEGGTEKTLKEVPSENVQNKAFELLELLYFYLEEGILPAGTKVELEELNQLLLKLLKRKEANLVTYLKNMPLDRLIKQFSESVLLAFSDTLILPQESSFVKIILDWMRAIYKRYGESLNIPDERYFVWNPILSGLVEGIKNKALFHKVTEDFVNQFKIDANTWAVWVNELKANDFPDQKKQIDKALEGILITTNSGEEDLDINADEKEIDMLKKLEGLLKLKKLGPVQFTKWRDTESKQLDIILEKQPNELKALFEQLVQDKSLELGLLMNMSNTQLEKIIELVFPSNFKKVMAYVELYEKLYKQHPEVFAKVPFPHLFMWEGILSYVFKSRSFKVEEVLPYILEDIQEKTKLDSYDIRESIFFLLQKKSTTFFEEREEIKNYLIKIKESELTEAAKEDTVSFDLARWLDRFVGDQFESLQEVLEQELLSAMAKRPIVLRNNLWEMIGETDLRIRMANQLSDKTYTAVLGILQPFSSNLIKVYLNDLNQLLNAKWVKTELLDYLFDLNEETFDLTNFVERIFRRYTKDEERFQKLVISSKKFLEVTRLESKEPLLAALSSMEKNNLEQPKRERKPFKPKVLKEDLYINNAGLVILWPFLSRFFSELGMLEERQFKDETTADRGVLLLQYLITGQTEAPEYELVLNKILCGLPLDYPVSSRFDPTEKEMELCEFLLNSVINNWDKMKNLPISNLRGSFLTREGRLKEEISSWELKVAPKAFDLLLDSLPWGISMVKLPWMDKILNVEWR